MKYLGSLLLLILTTGAFAQATTSADPAALTTTFFKAMLDEDAKAFGSIVTDDFMLTGPDGQTADKSLFTQALDGGYLVVDTGTTSNVGKPRVYNNDAAIVVGNWKQKGTLQNQAFNNQVAFTVVCARVGTNWKIASVQFSPLPN